MCSPSLNDPRPGEDGSTADPRGRRLSGVDESVFSLAYAVQAIARGSGCEPDPDDLAVALGLPFTIGAAVGEEDLARWPLYGRDAFLVEGGRLFGLTLRALHPPQAARGLERAPQFEQHFLASYKPLILRAIEHGQPVLAWRGWPGDHSGLWGVISDSCAQGIGLCGAIITASGRSPGDLPLVLDAPPVQLYVVETVAPVRPEAGVLLDAALDHARHALVGASADVIGVVTGPAALNAWIARLTGADVAAAPAGFACGHSRLAAAIIVGHESAVRFLSRHADSIGPGQRSLVQTLIESCRESVTSLSESTDAAAVANALRTPAGRRGLVQQVAGARAAATRMLTALQARAHAAGVR